MVRPSSSVPSFVRAFVAAAGVVNSTYPNLRSQELGKKRADKGRKEKGGREIHQ